MYGAPAGRKHPRGPVPGFLSPLASQLAPFESPATRTTRMPTCSRPCAPWHAEPAHAFLVGFDREATPGSRQIRYREKSASVAARVLFLVYFLAVTSSSKSRSAHESWGFSTSEKDAVSRNKFGALLRISALHWPGGRC